MFCKNCGKIIPANSKFCPECGASSNNASHSGEGYSHTKTKAEFLKEYRSTHSGYYGALFCSITCTIIGVIIILMNLDNISKIMSRYASDSTKFDAMIPFIITAVLWALGSIFLAVAKSQDREAQIEYERYLSTGETTKSSLPSNQSTNPARTNNTRFSEWICPKCGKRHAGYVGTCGCGEERPKWKNY